MLSSRGGALLRSEMAPRLLIEPNAHARIVVSRLSVNPTPYQFTSGELATRQRGLPYEKAPPERG
jgi:hypothetical protein